MNTEPRPMNKDQLDNAIAPRSVVQQQACSAFDVIPERGDLLCIRHGHGEWGYSGDKFSHFEGDGIVAIQTFANGEIRRTRGDDRKFRVLRGTKLFRVAMPNDPDQATASERTPQSMTDMSEPLPPAHGSPTVAGGYQLDFLKNLLPKNKT